MIPAGMTATEYRTIHHLVQKKKGRAAFCSADRAHESKRFEWANISGEYKDDLDDYESLCVSCHRKKDIKPDTRLKLRLAHLGQVSTRKKALVQKTKSGELIAEFTSLTEAYKKTGVLTTSICNALNGRSDFAGGFKWDYASYGK